MPLPVTATEAASRVPAPVMAASPRLSALATPTFTFSAMPFRSAPPALGASTATALAV